MSACGRQSDNRMVRENDAKMKGLPLLNAGSIKLSYPSEVVTRAKYSVPPNVFEPLGLRINLRGYVHNALYCGYISVRGIPVPPAFSLLGLSKNTQGRPAELKGSPMIRQWFKSGETPPGYCPRAPG